MAEQQATMVAVRLRPPSAKETAVRCIKTDGDKSVQFSNPDKSFSQYSYDKVFGESSHSSNFQALAAAEFSALRRQSHVLKIDQDITCVLRQYTQHRCTNQHNQHLHTSNKAVVHANITT
jgi:hypothetical protein